MCFLVLGNEDKLESRVIVLLHIHSEHCGGGQEASLVAMSQSGFCLKCYRSREERAVLTALEEVESEPRKFCFIRETFEMSRGMS